MTSIRRYRASSCSLPSRCLPEGGTVSCAIVRGPPHARVAQQPLPRPPPRSGEGETDRRSTRGRSFPPDLVALGLPLAASGRGLGGGVRHLDASARRHPFYCTRLATG